MPLVVKGVKILFCFSAPFICAGSQGCAWSKGLAARSMLSLAAFGRGPLQRRLCNCKAFVAQRARDKQLMAAEVSVAENLENIKGRIEAAAGKAHLPVPRLVAVSKYKPAKALTEAYAAGQRHFGENYAYEVVEKAPQLPDDIRWHFIGHLQSNKVKELVTIPNLWMVESVDSIKLANRLNNALNEREEPLKVLLQVDTSNEDTKSGISTDEAVEIAKHITMSCPKLKLAGVMTIGAIGDITAFDRLIEARTLVAKATGRIESELELSMGMSGDFEEAIAKGSTNVRIGSSIFGERDYSQKGEV